MKQSKHLHVTPGNADLTVTRGVLKQVIRHGEEEATIYLTVTRGVLKLCIYYIDVTYRVYLTVTRGVLKLELPISTDAPKII